MHRTTIRRLASLAALAVAFPLLLQAEVALAQPFTDHLVLQRGQPVPVWGSAGAGEQVTVAFAGQEKPVVADATGRWSVTLDPLTASEEPQVLSVRGSTTITIADVLVGEVWLCAGQSNMLASLDRLRTAGLPGGEDKQRALELIEREQQTTTPGIRLLQSGKGGGWSACGPESLKNREKGPAGFSAVGYFFGKRLRAELKVPIGLIQAAVGGSRIELWTPPEAYLASPAFSREAAATPLVVDGVEPGKYFRSLVRPLARFAVRGVIWYQGESNVLAGDDGPRYADKMQALIEGWRHAWSQRAMPFYYVQLPPFAYSRRSNPSRFTPQSLPYLREGQTAALRIRDTGMVVTTDLAPVNDMHPGDKWSIGQRLADLALAYTYGHTHIVADGPSFRAMEPRGGELVLTFAGGELVSRNDRPLTGFEIAGDDRVFVPADAVIEAGRVVVLSAKVPQPVAVRFAWREESRPNLVNAAGLPAVPFRSDDWPVAKQP
jgi:sialate O-acetylesterase